MDPLSLSVWEIVMDSLSILGSGHTVIHFVYTNK